MEPKKEFAKMLLTEWTRSFMQMECMHLYHVDKIMLSLVVPISTTNV